MKTRIITSGIITVLFSTFSYLLLHQFGYEIADSRFVLLGYVALLLAFAILLIKKKHRINTLKVFGVSIAAYTLIIALLHINHPLVFYKNLKINAKQTPYNWETADLSDFDIDTEEFNSVMNKMHEMYSIRSILVIKNGKLIAEKYFEGAKPHFAMNIKSATKSVTSTMVGIAIQEGFIKSVDEKVIDYFPEYTNKVNDKRKLNITIANILSMQSGLRNMIPPKKDFTVENIFTRFPMDTEVGNEFRYHSPAAQLIPAIIERASGMSFNKFAETYLYKPLGISCPYWQMLPDKLNQADCEAYFTPRDFARIGYLYENGGKINGKQIIDSTFLAKATSEQSLPGGYGNFDDCFTYESYGYWWWVRNTNGYKEFTARGAGGQYIHVVPEFNLVIAIMRKHWNGGNYILPEQDKRYLMCELISCFKE